MNNQKIETKKPATCCSVTGCLNHAVSMDGTCAPHSNGDGRILCYTAQPAPPRNAAAPHGALGFEVEWTAPSSVQRTCYAVGRTTAAGSNSRSICHRDGSVDGEHKLAGKCCGTRSIISAVVAMSRRLYIAGARADHTCGGHVHIDARPPQNSPHGSGSWANRLWAQTRVRPVADWLANHQAQWFETIPSSRRGTTTDGYNRLVNTSVATDPKRFFRNGQDGGHFTWVNYRPNIGTLEIRLHPGTLHPIKIRGWGAVCADLLHLMRGPATDSELIALADSTDGPFSNMARNDIWSPLAWDYLTARRLAGGSLSLRYPIICE